MQRVVTADLCDLPQRKQCNIAMMAIEKYLGFVFNLLLFQTQAKIEYHEAGDSHFKR